MCMAVCMAVLLAAKAAGLHVTLASYAAGATGALLVTLHEWLLPYRREWSPPAGELRVDALFLVTLHMMMPYLLGLAVTFWVAEWLAANDLAPTALWPHSWPVAAQVALMLLLIDFVRYWIHCRCIGSCRCGGSMPCITRRSGSTG